MGLCKCPKKKVTNQFCFEHRVNVCEHCMVSNHPKCVVQSYLQWLQDSDYNPICEICSQELATGDCVRLICYHIFHWECLDRFASSLPPHTAPAGYTCPVCNVCLFPASNVVSPIAECLRATLSQANWARPAFGLPLVDSGEENRKEEISSSTTPNNKFSDHSKHASLSNHAPTPEFSSDNWASKSNSNSVRNSIPPPVNVSATTIASPMATQSQMNNIYSSMMSGPISSPRKLYDATEEYSLLNTSVDHDENKYKRRSALEWLARWFKSRANLRGRHDPHWKFKRCAVIAVLALFTFFTLIMIFKRLGRAVADEDPFLDPMANPQIRVNQDKR